MTLPSIMDATETTAQSGMLVGERTLLRPAHVGFTVEEIRKRFDWSQDSELQYWSGKIPSAKTFSEFRRLLPERDWPADGRRQSFGIFDATGNLIGMVSAYSLDWTARTGELGVYIGERNRWGQGLGTDAIKTLVGHLFGTLSFRSIHLNTYATNLRALRSYAKVGFKKTAARRRFRPSIGYYREVTMEIDRDRFLELHGALASGQRG